MRKLHDQATASTSARTLFLRALVSTIASALGNSVATAIIKKYVGSSSNDISQFNKETATQATIDLLTRAGQDLGTAFAESVARRAYQTTAQELPTERAALLALVPSYFLQEERAQLMSRQELESGLVARTHELEQANVKLEETVLERTKELAKANEDLQRASEAKTNFLSMVAHQLRTPLTEIKWSLEEIAHEPQVKASRTLEENIRTLFDVTTRTITLVGSLLDVARIEEGRFNYVFKRIDPTTLIQSVVAELKQTAHEKGVLLELIAPADSAPFYLQGDADKLRLALENLVENAIKYTLTGKKVTVSVSCVNNAIHVAVADEGIGIPVAEQSQIFGRFFRASNTKKHRINGNGLGLYIVRDIIQAHNGTVSFTSEENVGTTFKLAFPLST